jgi:hypothetical protein
VLVIGTLIVTSLIFAGIRTFNSVSKQAKNETQTNEIAQSISSPNNTPSPNEIAQSVSSPNNTPSITGTLVINKWINGVEGQLCSGENGYGDIESGIQILVKNNKGEILATGQLGLGQLVKTPVHEIFQDIANESELGTPLTCQFPIDIENIPKADFYTFEIGRRGGITYTAKQLQQQSWKIKLSLG